MVSTGSRLVCTTPKVWERYLTCIDGDEPEWIIEQARARKRKELLRRREDMESRLRRIRAKEKVQRDKYLKGDQSSLKKRKTDPMNTGGDESEELYLLEDYDSDDDQSKTRNSAGGLSAATLELMQKLGMNLNTHKDEDEEAEDEIKVRSHIQ
jgi:chromosome transmission fidelity protein 1